MRWAVVLPAGLALLAGLSGALLLPGVPAAVTGERLAQVHGPLLVLGFLGTLVAAERAVALRRAWGFAAPAALGVGGLLLLPPAVPVLVGRTLLLLGAATLLGVYAALWRRQESRALALQVLGAVLATGSALLWLGGVPSPALAPWFAGFVVLTIAGEQLELARLTLGTPGERRVLGLGTGVAAAAAGTLLWPAVAQPLLGGVLLALVGVLLRDDVARPTVRSTGLPRWMAWCLLAGYGWLAVAGGLWLVAPVPLTEGPVLDAVLAVLTLAAVLIWPARPVVAAHPLPELAETAGVSS